MNILESYDKYIIKKYLIQCFYRRVVLFVWILSVFLAVPVIWTKVSMSHSSEKSPKINLLSVCQDVFTYHYANCTNIESVTYCNDSEESFG